MVVPPTTATTTATAATTKATMQAAAAVPKEPVAQGTRKETFELLLDGIPKNIWDNKDETSVMDELEGWQPTGFIPDAGDEPDSADVKFGGATGGAKCSLSTSKASMCPEPEPYLHLNYMHRLLDCLQILNAFHNI